MIALGTASTTRGKHTVYLALTLDGLLDFSCPSLFPTSSHTSASSSQTSSIHRTSFLTRTLSYLRPFPSPHSVLITPSSAMYTHPAFRVAIEARGAKLLHYPRYAQDLNPLERAGERVGAWAAARRQLMSREPQTAWDPMPPYDSDDAPDALFDAL